VDSTTKTIRKGGLSVVGVGKLYNIDVHE
jgi:hypothetical protein